MATSLLHTLTPCHTYMSTSQLWTPVLADDQLLFNACSLSYIILILSEIQTISLATPQRPSYSILVKLSFVSFNKCLVLPIESAMVTTTSLSTEEVDLVIFVGQLHFISETGAYLEQRWIRKPITMSLSVQCPCY